VELGALKAACRRPNSSRIQWKTNGAVIVLPSNTLLFRSFQMFHTVYMSKDATCRRCSLGNGCKEDTHQLTGNSSLSGISSTHVSFHLEHSSKIKLISNFEHRISELGSTPTLVASEQHVSFSPPLYILQIHFTNKASFKIMVLIIPSPPKESGSYRIYPLAAGSWVPS
jgi:hypothetical protein